MPELVHSVLWVLLAMGLLRRLLLAPRVDRGRAALFLALVVGATLLRFVLASWGPGDLRMTTATIFEPPASVGEEPPSFYLSLADFGATPDGLFRLLFLVLPASDTTIVATNIVLGGLCPLLAALLVEALGLSRLAALLTAILMGVMPLLVRFAGEGSRVTMLLFLSLCGLWLYAEHARRRRWGPLLLGTVALVLAVGCRPEAAMVGPIAALLLLRRVALRRGLWLRLLALAIVASAALANNPSTNLDYVHLVLFPFLPEHVVWLDPGYIPVWMLVAFFLGLVLLVRREPQIAGWSAFSLVLVAWLTHGALEPTGHGNLASSRYQVLALPFFALVTGAGLSFVVAWARRFLPRRSGALLGGVIALALLGSTWPTLQSVTAHRTIDDEYALFREVLPELPAGAEIYFVVPPRDSVLWPPRYLAAMFGRTDLRWRAWPPEATARGPRFYWRSSACSLALTCRGEESRDAASIPRTHAQCAEAEALPGARPRTVRVVPAVSFAGICYQEDQLQVGLYEMQDER